MKRKINLPFEQEWEKELSRIKRFIKNAEKRGFSFEGYLLPTKPQVITEKSVSRLKRITPETLYKKAHYTLPSGGILSGTRGRKLERSIASQKAALTRLLKNPHPVDAPVKKLTPNAKEWKKQVTRINKLIDNLQRRGYLVDRGIIPQMPRRVTNAALEKLRGITSNNIYEIVQYDDNGNIVSGIEGRKKERSNAAKKGHLARINKTKKGTQETPRDRFYKNRYDMGDVGIGKAPTGRYAIIENIREQIRNWVSVDRWSNYWKEVKRNDKNILERLLEGTIRLDGERTVADRLEANAILVNHLVSQILYSGSGGKGGHQPTQLNLAEFAKIITGKSLTPEEASEYSETQELMEDEEI